ncbi:hypothetical protein MKW98_009159 [Papaver atlanticum]|uniref:Neprosin PEP catalytic domain-containing protein n=1 Tax=Papaver atlanticum TaxID=357466 RepID=A0AAD4XQ02_9MAGN|nr:hypothetical protein MKW98_009159 [Papaver atlanticum]
MRPSSLPKKSSSTTQSLKHHSKPLGCPYGTVPIKRTSKEDLIRSRTFSESSFNNVLSRRGDIEQQSILKVAPAGQHLAILGTDKNITTPIYGVHAHINIANPTVGNDEFSSAQVWIESGPADDVNTIQAGWAVAPSLFGDNKTRFFIYWDAKPNTGCYNQICPGFVQVDKDYTVGSVIDQISVYDGPQYRMKLAIYQDRETGHWWLQAGEEDKFIGYWPNSLFAHMGNQTIQGAEFNAWGGLVKTSQSGLPSPQMGNGHFPNGDYYEACSIVNLQIMDDFNHFVNINKPGLDFDRYADRPDCYNIEDRFHSKREDQQYGFLFGGPGGANC